jgi:hypothetical protein
LTLSCPPAGFAAPPKAAANANIIQIRMFHCIVSPVFL